MYFTLTGVSASDAEGLLRSCDFPAMRDHPIRLTMFPRSRPETQEEEIRWMTNVFRHSLEKDESKYRKVCTDDGSPVGFAGWSLLNSSDTADTRDDPIQRGQIAVDNPEPETLNTDTLSQVSNTLKEEQDRILKGRTDIWCRTILLHSHLLHFHDPCLLFLGLSVIAVNPVYQRQGIGAMLMQWACDEADRNGRDGFLLASTAGAKLFEKFGFENVGEVSTAKGSLRSMFRKANTGPRS